MHAIETQWELQLEGYDAFVCAFTTETMQLVGGQRLEGYDGGAPVQK